MTVQKRTKVFVGSNNVNARKRNVMLSFVIPVGGRFYDVSADGAFKGARLCEQGRESWRDLPR